MILPLFQFKNVLAIGAHPDDIEFSCLGLLLRMDSAVDKHVYVASLGSAGDSTSGLGRRDESTRALSGIQPKTLRFRLKNGIQSSEFAEVLSDLEDLISSRQPDLILCAGPKDSHQEHRLTYEILLAASRRSKASILTYGILSNTPDFRPSVFVDIESVYSRKVEALRAHESQRRKYYMSDEYLRAFHFDKYASLHGLNCCEGYEVVRFFL